MRNNKSTDNTWLRCVVNTVQGAGGEYGAAASFGSPDFWNGDTSYSKEGGGFLVQVPNDGQAWMLLDGTVLNPDIVYLLNYEVNRDKSQTPPTLTRAEVGLMVLRGDWVEPHVEDCYATHNENDGKGVQGITYLPFVFKHQQAYSIELANDVLNHPDYPAEGVGADPLHIAKLIDRARSHSVDLSLPTHWQWLKAINPATGLNGYQQMTKDILTKAEALGLTVDYSNWHNTVPYVDASGDSHPEFLITVRDGTTKLDSITGVAGQTELELIVVHPYPRP
jgi:hypothetical protein